jgi:tRNA/tmRNA/rRNA uracil-C5-methylase (TrmA/RlmC/RlmD family)
MKLETVVGSDCNDCMKENMQKDLISIKPSPLINVPNNSNHSNDTDISSKKETSTTANALPTTGSLEDRQSQSAAMQSNVSSKVSVVAEISHASNVISNLIVSKTRISKKKRMKLKKMKEENTQSDLLSTNENTSAINEDKSSSPGNIFCDDEKSFLLKYATEVKEKDFQDPSAQYLHCPNNTPLVKDARAYFKQMQVDFAVYVGPIRGWRTHAKLAVRAGLDTQLQQSKQSRPSQQSSSGNVRGSSSSTWVAPVIGLFAPGTHQVVSLARCAAHHPSINYAVAVIQHGCKLFQVSGYNEETGKGDLRYIVMSVERNTLQVQCTLVWNEPEASNGENSEAKWTELCNWLYSYRLLAEDAKTIQQTLNEQQPFTQVKLSSTSSSLSSSVSNHRAKCVPVHSSSQSSTSTSRSTNEDHQSNNKQIRDSIKDQLLFHSIWIHRRSGNDNAIFARSTEAWSCQHGAESVLECMHPISMKDFRTSIAAVAKTSPLQSNPFLHRNDDWKTAPATVPCEAGRVFNPVLLFPPMVFRQANITGFGRIVQAIRAWIPANSKVIELYGGVGTIGLNVADLCSSLYSSDENPYNKVCFERAVSLLPMNMRSKLIYETRSGSSVAEAGYLTHGLDGKGVDVVIVDPPRKGLDDPVVHALMGKNCQDQDLKKGPSICIYVSCGFKALKRDLANLLMKERPSSAASSSVNNLRISSPAVSRPVWKIVHAEGHVLFPGADHLETLVVLQRQNKV